MGQTLYAQADGNASAIAWNTAAGGGGSSVAWGSQANDDTLDCNAHDVTIDTDSWTRAALVSLSGGTFLISVASGVRSFTANIGRAALDSADTVLTISGDGNALTVGGSVYGGSGAACYGINPVSMNGATLTVTGSVYGGANATAYGVFRMDSSGILVVTGAAEASVYAPAIQVCYRGTLTVGSLKAANGKPAIIPYSDYYTLITSGTVESSADGTFPAGGNAFGCKLRMTGTTSGQVMKVRDNSGTPAEKILKVPDYPAVADVKDGTAFDYTTKTGTYNPTAAAVYPAAADVWHDTGAYGPTGSDYTPEMVGSDIANLEAGNVKKDVTIDDVTGTYEGEGGGGIFMPRPIQIGV